MRSFHRRALAGILCLVLLFAPATPANPETVGDVPANDMIPSEETAESTPFVSETVPAGTLQPAQTPEPVTTPATTDGTPDGMPPPGSCPETALVLKEGRTAKGAITGIVPVLYYALSVSKSGSYTFVSGGSLSITAMLLDGDGRFMASLTPDNPSASASDSRYISQTLSLKKGTGYMLAVQSAVPGKTGNFTIGFSQEDVLARLPVPETTVGPEPADGQTQETSPAPAGTGSPNELPQETIPATASQVSTTETPQDETSAAIEPVEDIEAAEEVTPAPAGTDPPTELPQETIPATASPINQAEAPQDEAPALEEQETDEEWPQETAQSSGTPVDATETSQETVPAAPETVSVTELQQEAAPAAIIQDDDIETAGEETPAPAEPEPATTQPQETGPVTTDETAEPPQWPSPAPSGTGSPTALPPQEATPAPEVADAASPSPVPTPAMVPDIGNSASLSSPTPSQTALPLPVGVLRSQGAAGWPVPPASKGINLYPESAHPYANSMTADHYYEEPDAVGYAVTFHSDTYVEAGLDFLYLLDKDKEPLAFTDAENNVWERFTGDQADNVTLIISSPGFYTRLAANDSASGYGFRYSSIIPIYPASAGNCILYICEQKGPYTVELVWNKVDGADAYTLYRSSGGDFRALKSVTGTSTVNLSLTPGETYTYKVRPYTLSGLSRVYGAYSNEKSVLILSIPLFVKAAAVDASTAYLDWEDVPQADGYNLYRATQPSGTYKYIKSITESYALDGILACGVTHYYKVTPWRMYSTRVFGAQSAASAGIQYSAPSLTLVRQSDRQAIRIEWTAQAGATGYTLYRSTSADGIYTGIKSVQDCYTNNYNLTPGLEYFYKVRAYTDVNGRRWYGAYTGSLGVRILAAPVITGISVSGTTASMQWGPVNDATGYMLYRAEIADGPYRYLKSTTNLTIKNFNLDPGRTYYYKICAYRMYGTLTVKGALSAPAKVTVPSGIRYRALAIGQSDYLYLSTLHGAADAANVTSMLANLSMDGQTYQTTLATNLTAGQILSAIPGAFAGAGDNDVSLFFYSGHGNNSTGELAGSLYGIDSGTVTPAQLKSALDAVPGTVIVLIDSCGSGTYIYDGGMTKASGGTATKADAYAFTSAVISAFSGSVSKYGELLESKYKVLTASEYGEYSYETSLGGIFTNALCKAGGWDPISHARTDLLGDSNADSVVTLQEGYTYIYNNTDLAYQVVQVYPYGSSFPLFCR